MRPNNGVFDTGAAPSLLWEDLFKPDRLSLICPGNNTLLNGATNQTVKVIGTFVVHVRFGESRVHVMFGIVAKLEVPGRLATSFIDKCTKDIFQTD